MSKIFKFIFLSYLVINASNISISDENFFDSSGNVCFEQISLTEPVQTLKAASEANIIAPIILF